MLFLGSKSLEMTKAIIIKKLWGMLFGGLVDVAGKVYELPS